MAKSTDPNLKCSFCGKTQDQVKKLIAGPDVCICDECIELCNEILDEELFNFKQEDKVVADEVKVDGETRNLTVKLPNRNYTLKYTNILNTEEITVNPDTEITYEMANGENGWNKGTQTAQNTYLVVPGEPPVDPIDPPVDPIVPPVDPVDPVDPPATPDPREPQDNDNVKILNNLQRDQINAAIDANQVYTPVAYAADLDDEIDTNVRKNVDGSVTVVRAFTPSK